MSAAALQTAGEADEAVVQAIGFTFARVSRAIRQTDALTERLEHDQGARGDGTSEARRAAALERAKLAPYIEGAPR